jgi:hypothetical protein
MDNHEESYGLSSGKHAAAVLTGLTRLKMIDIANILGISYSSLRTWSSGDPVYQGIERSVMGLYSGTVANYLKKIMDMTKDKGGPIRFFNTFDKALETVRKHGVKGDLGLNDELLEIVKDPGGPTIKKILLTDQFDDTQIYIPELISNVGKSYFYIFAGNTEMLANCQREEFINLAELIFNGHLSELSRVYNDNFIILAWKELEASLESLVASQIDLLSSQTDSHGVEIKERKESFSKGDYMLLRELKRADYGYHSFYLE